MKSLLSTLSHAVLSVCVICILLLGPSQYSFEIAPRTFVSPVDPVVWLALLALLFSRNRPTLRELIRSLPVTGMCFLVLAALSLLRAENLLKGVKEIFQFVEYFVAAYLVFVGSLRDPALRHVSFRMAGVAATLILLLALIQYGVPFFPDFRVAGTFGNSNVLGGFLALTMPVWFGLLACVRRPFFSLWHLVCLAGSAFVLLAGGAAVGVMVAVLLVAAFRGTRTILFAVVVMVLVCLFAWPHMPRTNSEAFIQSASLYDNDGAPTQRYTEWQAALFMTRENPLLGVGAGNYQDNIGMHYGYLPSPEHAAEPDSQNLYLVLASSCGIPALLFFAALLLEIMSRAVRRYYVETDPMLKGLLIGVAGSMVAFAIACIWSPLLVRGIGIPLAFLFAMTTLRSSDQ